jgi:hypothetical protein
VFTDGRQRQLNHNTTTYCVYWRTTTTINPIIIRPDIVFRIMIGLLLLSSVSKHNMWSYYDWVYCWCRPSVNTICGRIMIGFIVVVIRQKTQYVVVLWLGLLLLSNTTTYYVYCRTTTTINPVIIRPHIVFTDGRQQRQPNHNTTTYCFYWRTTTMYYDLVYCCCLPSVNTICGRIMIGFIVAVRQ